MFLLLRLWLLATLLPLGQVNHRLDVHLRHSDGTAVVGEALVLEQLPEMTAVLPRCLTDEAGHCSWYVPRGLYQARFTRSLDLVTALALAEGGLEGFGLTVGDEPVGYHFVLHTDKQIYFDAAPERPLPQPIIPTFDEIQGGYEPTATAPAISLEMIPVVETAVAPEVAEMDESGNGRFPGRLLIFIGSGLLLGGIVALWSRQRPGQRSPLSELHQGENDA